jgi:hypothetical protein
MDRGIGFGERAHAGDPQDRQESIDLARAHSLLGDTFIFLKRGRDALPHAQRGLALLEDVRSSDPTNQRWRRVYCLEPLAQLAWHMNSWPRRIHRSFP